MWNEFSALKLAKFNRFTTNILLVNWFLWSAKSKNSATNVFRSSRGEKINVSVEDEVKAKDFLSLEKSPREFKEIRARKKPKRVVKVVKREANKKQPWRV